IFIALVLLVAGAGVIFWSFSDSTSDSQLDQNTQGGASSNISQVLLTGQVLGSLAAAEQSLHHADFAAAERAIATTYQWIEDSALPADTRARRAELRARIERLLELDSAFATAIADADCSRAR